MQYFQDDMGRFSAMRTNCFLALVMSAYLSMVGTEFNIVMIWLVAAFAPKAIQKFAERK